MIPGPASSADPGGRRVARSGYAPRPRMAPRPQYATPIAQMTVLAADARDRGLSFDEWWEEAIRPGRGAVTPTTPGGRRPAGCVVWPNDSFDQRTWREAILQSKEAWRRAYDREPVTRGDAALRLLAPALERAGLAELVAA